LLVVDFRLVFRAFVRGTESIMDPAMVQAASQMTPEQAKEMLDKLSPEEREQAMAQQQKMQQGMLGLAHLATVLEPPKEDPDAEVPMIKLARALATSPAMSELGTDQQQLLGKLEYAVAKDALSKVEDKLEELGALKTDELNDIENECHWRNTVLIYWHMFKQAADQDFIDSLPGEVDYFRGGANQIATKLLIQSQMLMPQKRWVQVTLTVAKMSALMATALWSHTDPEALAKMAKITSDDQLPQPKLGLSASATWKENPGNTEIPAGQNVKVTVELKREHASDVDPGSMPPCNNPQGIYEAYWLYIEGRKPQGTPNSLIVAKPLVVQDLTAKVVTGEALFQAPPKPGEYHLRVYVTSTSVIGIDLKADVKFTVVEDDVPDLE